MINIMYTMPFTASYDSSHPCTVVSQSKMQSPFVYTLCTSKFVDTMLTSEHSSFTLQTMSLLRMDDVSALMSLLFFVMLESG